MHLAAFLYRHNMRFYLENRKNLMLVFIFRLISRIFFGEIMWKATNKKSIVEIIG